MTREKRYLSLFLAILMCLSLLPVGALADEEASAEPEEIIEEVAAESAEAEEAAEAEAPVKAEIPAEPEEAIPSEEEPTEIEEPAEPEESTEGEESVEQEEISAEAMGASMTFTPRTTAPATSNSYYYSSSNPLYAGYKGNCTWYAFGRAYEILGTKPKLCTNDANLWYSYNKSYGYYSYGSTPKIGAIACYADNGLKHVAVVEDITNGVAYVSEFNHGGDKSFHYGRPVNEWGTPTGYIYILGDSSGTSSTTTTTISGISVSNLAKTTATVNASCSYTGSGKPSEVGLRLGTSSSNLSKKSSDTIPENQNKNPFDIWYDLTGLTAGTTYYYQLYYVVNGTTKYTSVYSFTTSGTTITYTIKYNANGGENPPPSQTKTKDVALTLSSTKPTRTGYTFQGWSTSSTATSATYKAGGSYTANSSATLYAVWKANTFTLRYNANGGTGTMADTTVTYGVKTHPRTNTFTRKGYTFAGWYAQRASDGKYRYKSADGSETGWYKQGSQPSGWTYSYYLETSYLYTTTSVDKDIVTLYANWKANTFTVKYNANGGSGTMANTAATYGVKTNLRANTFTRTGYTFSGWYAYRASDGTYRYSSADGSQTNWYKQGSQPSSWTYFNYLDTGWVSTTSVVDKDTVTMYAMWEPITLTISYDANGGKNPPPAQKKVYLEALTLSSVTPTWDGYTFLGWSASKTATKATYLPGKTYTSISSTTLYAVWSANTKTPQLVVSSAAAPVGKTVSVPVSLKDNPGINTFTIKINYDSAKLTLGSVTPASALGGTFLYTESTHTVTWQAAKDTTYDGVAFTMNFTVLSGIQSGSASVSLSYTKGNICNYDEQDVDFSIVAGTVSAGSYMPGDINGDGAVNNKDLNRLMKYLADNSTEVVKAALDVNGDGSVNNKDLNRLMKYLADATVEIH